MIVHLHAAVPVFQRALSIAEIEALLAGAGYVRAVERCILVGPEFDIAARKALTLLDAFSIGKNVQLGHVCLKSRLASGRRHANLRRVVGVGVHRDTNKLSFLARLLQFQPVGDPVEFTIKSRAFVDVIPDRSTELGQIEIIDQFVVLQRGADFDSSFGGGLAIARYVVEQVGERSAGRPAALGQCERRDTPGDDDRQDEPPNGRQPG